MMYSPLSAILRPKKLNEVIGQEHLLGPNMPLSRMASSNKYFNLILWGPPGCGKTSIISALANDVNANFHKLNATDATVKDLRKIISQAQENPDQLHFVLVDECHRWSKSQQDVLLPVIEDGTIIFFGLTTERPKFAVNSTILSRCLVLEVKPLNAKESIDLVLRVKEYYLHNENRHIKICKDALKRLINRSSGDARKIINTLETCIEVLCEDDQITVANIDTAIPDKHLVFDSSGNDHFDLAHCYQEAIQHSDVDAAIYWLAKWIASGEDPAYICRRMLITAFEDCAANPNAWLAAMAATFTTERTGLPECMIPMALATCEMGTSKRNKSAYYAIKEAMSDVENGETIHVPEGLRAGTSGYIYAITKKYVKGFKDEHQ